MATKLTAAFVKSAPAPESGRRIIYDNHPDAPKGFGVRITAKGARAFVLRYKPHEGTDRIMTIGSFPAWSLPAARAEATERRREIEQGADPIGDKRTRAAAEEAAKVEAAQQRALRERFTLRALCGAYVAHLKATGKDSYRDAASAFKCHLLEVPALAEIVATPAREIGPDQIALIVRRAMEAGKVRTAGVLRSYLNAAFTAARKAPYDPKLPSELIPFAVTSNPVEVIATVPTKAGTRALTAEELRAYLLAFGDELPDVALRLALYAGGQRIAQLLRATVRDFDPDNETLLLYDGKGKRREPRPHLLPLGATAAALVRGLIERAPKRDNPSLFISRGRVLHPDTLSKRVVAISGELDGDPFDLRAVRRTVETQMAALGVGKDVRAHLLSHGLTGVQVQHYDRHDYLAEKRRALELWEKHLERLRNGGKVIPLVREAG